MNYLYQNPLEGTNGPNRKEIGAKLIKEDKNTGLDVGTAAGAEARKMTRDDLEQAKDENADAAIGT